MLTSCATVLQALVYLRQSYPQLLVSILPRVKVYARVAPKQKVCVHCAIDLIHSWTCNSSLRPQIAMPWEWLLCHGQFNVSIHSHIVILKLIM